jgi:cyclophilin family peptidyl-prolyl cis-trans isomerase
VRRLSAPVACLLLPALVLGGCGDNQANVPSNKERERTGTQTLATTPPDAVRPRCERVTDEPDQDRKERKRPKLKLDRRALYTAEIVTSCGTMEVRLASRLAPRTAAAFVALARDGFYDGLPFHRIVPEFVVQGGSPNGSPTGGPGYSVVEAPPDQVRYRRGTVAMAKSGVERPGTSGSQFFIVLSDRAPLDPLYAVLGQVTRGLDTLDRIAGVPLDPSADGRPTQPVLIERVRIRERRPGRR